MKRIFGLFTLTLLTVSSWSQEIQQKNIPAVVLNTFQLKFSNASDIDWRLEKGLYRVNFELNEKDNQLAINDKGVIIKHIQDLYFSEIPKSVLETIKSKVTFFDIGDADLTEEDGKITYNIRMKINDNDLEFIINERGTLLKYYRELNYSEVPAAIKDLINTRFGTLDDKNASYSEENGKGLYRITGEVNDMKHIFEFDSKNVLVKHEQDLRNSEVPVQILNAVSASFSGYEIRDADLSNDEGKVTYFLELRKSKEVVIVSFNPEGKTLEVKKR